MPVSREPGSPVQATRLPVHRSAARSAGVDDLVRAAAARVAQSDDARGGEILTSVAVHPGLIDLSERSAEELGRLGRDEGTTDEVRAAALAAVGSCRRRRGDHEGARDALLDAARLNLTPAVAAALAAVTVRIEGFPAAEAILQEARDRWPDNIQVTTDAVDVALDAGQLTVAADWLDTALQRDPGRPVLVIRSARLNLQRDSPAEAATAARAVVPALRSPAQAVLAVALHRTGDLLDDPALLDAVVAGLPGDEWLLTMVGQMLLEVTRPADARRAFDAALRLAADSVDALRGRAVAHALGGDYRAAAADLEASAQFGSDDWLTALRGEVARLLGDASRTVELLGSLDPETTPAWVLVSFGSALVALLRYGDAQAAYAKALEKEPENVDALCGSADIIMATSTDDAVQERVIPLLDLALRSDPGHARAHALRAEAWRRAGHLSRAIEEFDVALSTTPDYPWALASKGQALASFGELDAAVDALAVAARQAESTEWIIDELVHTVERLDAESGGSRSDSVLRQVQWDVRARGGDIGLLLRRRARLAQKRGKADAALRLYRQAFDRQATDTNLVVEYIGALQEARRDSEALNVLEGLPADILQDPQLAWLRIELLWSQERLAEAQTELEQITRGEHPSTQATAALGEIYRAKGRPVEARRLLDKAHAEDPSHTYTLASLGALELDGDHVTEARRHLHAVLADVPNYPFALMQLVSLELGTGRADEVRRLLDGAAELSDEPEVARVLAIGYYGLGEYSAALQIVRDALIEAADNVPLLRLKGSLELAMSQSTRAADSFLAVAELPDVPSGLFDTVTALLRVDRWDAALRQTMSQLQTLNPYVDTSVAQLWLHAGAWEAAVAPALAGQEGLPDDSTSTRIASRALRHAGQFDRALEFARVAQRMAPRDIDVLAEVAECELAIDELRPAARASFERLLRRQDAKVHADSGEMNLQGWCFLRLGRTDDASHAFLRALSATVETTPVLQNLVLTSLLEGDVRQAETLLKRVDVELDRLSVPTRRGLLAAAAHDLRSIDAELRRREDASARRYAMELITKLDRRRDALDEALAEIIADSPLALRPPRPA